MKNILFVCTGNTCRSPMAVGLLKHALREKDIDEKGFRISSAGAFATGNLPASQNAITVMKEIGIDISRHISQPLTSGIVNGSDFIFVMTEVHRLEVLNLLKKRGIFIKLVGEFYPKKGKDILEIPDPIGRPVEVYRKCRDMIKECIPGIIQFIMENH